MTELTSDFDGPRLMRGSERSACSRLARLCFGDEASGDEASGDEAGGEEPDESVADEPAPRRGGLYLIAYRGQPVSQIGIFHHRLKAPDGLIRVGSVGGVCTHPEFREQRLAGRLLKHCTQQLMLEGARLMLISGDRGLYTRAGCALSGRYLDFDLRPGQLQVETRGLALRALSSADAVRCSQLYQAEGMHFLRRPDDFARALYQPNGYIHADQWMVERDGQAAAYLLLGIPWDAMAAGAPKIRHLSEYAGSRAALAGGLSLALAQHGISQISAPVAWQDADLIALLEQGGGRSQLASLREHTMRIINFSGLMADLGGYVRGRLESKLRRGLRFSQNGSLLAGNDDDRCTIQRGADRLELDTATMTRLVMGDAAGVSFTAPGALAEVIAALFPLPAFFPGLNYQ